MAVSTNLGLYLPTREDYISVQRDLSNNYEVIDESAGMLEKGIAIVVDGDSAPRAISSGDYLFIKNHSTLATGGYHATANIANGAAVTSSNTASDAKGVANTIKGDVDALNSNLNSLIPQKTIKESSAVTSRTLNIGSGVRATIDYITNQPTRCLSIIVTTDGSGTVYVLEKVKGSDASYDRTANNKLTITTSDARQGWFFIMTDTKTNLDTITIV